VVSLIPTLYIAYILRHEASRTKTALKAGQNGSFAVPGDSPPIADKLPVKAGKTTTCRPGRQVFKERCIGSGRIPGKRTDQPVMVRSRPGIMTAEERASRGPVVSVVVP
ncbi:MAG: hypothetical protein LBP81_06540, partial [Treponema sp.]|nr:hypothetical protein [Treponema sp.]